MELIIKYRLISFKNLYEVLEHLDKLLLIFFVCLDEEIDFLS